MAHGRWLIYACALTLLAVGCGDKKKESDKAATATAPESPKGEKGEKAAAEVTGADKGEAPKKAEDPGEKQADKADKPAEVAVTDNADKPGTPPPGAPELKLVKAGLDVDWAAIKKGVAKHKGKVVVCKNLLAPVPLAVNENTDKQPKSLIEGEVDDRRSAFFCRTKAGGLDTVPAQVYFNKGDKGQLLHVDQDTIVNLEVRGEVGNQVVAVFRGVVSAPRRQVFDSKAPDLMSALLWPDKFKGRSITCMSKMAVTPQKVARFDRAAVELVGGKVDVQKALVRCEDSGGGGVSVTVFFPEGQGKNVLELGADTVFSVKLHGFDRNQLVGLFQKLQSGGVKADAGELKQVLVDPSPHIGKKLDCSALVAPQPREIGAIDEKETKLLKVKLDDRKTALMCGQRSGGSVGVSLYFKAGQKRQVLRMAANSKLKFTFWGVVHNRLIGVFDSITGGAIETKDPNDMRAVALSAAKFAGKTVTCDINLQPFVSGLSYMGDAKEALLKNEVLSDKHAVITCKDATGSLGGTRVEVYFRKVDASEIDGLEKGSKVQLRVKGSAFSTLIAIFDKKLG